ncbi:hypothetical protein [Allofournierella massiliensis]|uniref:hypothetical protein n=1 Tax=Allofournierella massiliensis TaxID=1650663 RepID=UPI003562A8D8
MFIIDKQLLNVNGPEQKIFGIARPGRWHRKSAPGGQKFGNRGPENGEKRLFKRIRFRYNGKSETFSGSRHTGGPKQQEILP